MRKHPLWWAIIAWSVLIIPTLIYLIILVPKLSEEYNVLMASGGVIGGAGLYGAEKITDKLKFSGMYKLAARSFTIMTVITIVEKFIIELIGLVAVFIISYITFKVLMEVYRNATRRKECKDLRNEVASILVESSK